MDDSYQLKLAAAGTDGLQLTLSGSWEARHALPESDQFESWLDSHPNIKQIGFDSTVMTAWDSALLTFLVRVTAIADKHNIEVDHSGLPDGVQRLLHLASAVPERKGAKRTAGKAPFLARIGNQSMAVADSATQALAFLGEATLSGARLLRGKAQFRWSDLVLILQQTGAQAFGIVALISFLVGMILAYIGAAQLVNFGATMYVADLVGIGMARAMGAMMTGIVMAGRTGVACRPARHHAGQ